MARRAGLVLRGTDRALYFVGADVARGLVAEQDVSRVPGVSVGMALVGGEVVPVLPLGADAAALVLCSAGGELVAFAGLTPEASGFFDGVEGGVRFGKEHARELDVEARVAEFEAELRLARRGANHGA